MSASTEAASVGRLREQLADVDVDELRGQAVVEPYRAAGSSVADAALVLRAVALGHRAPPVGAGDRVAETLEVRDKRGVVAVEGDQ